MMPLVQMTAYFTYIAMAVMGKFLCNWRCDRGRATAKPLSNTFGK